MPSLPTSKVTSTEGTDHERKRTYPPTSPPSTVPAWWCPAPWSSEFY